MGRLIDADKLLETLQDLEPHCENKDYEYGMLNTIRYYMPKIINDEPTVFDVDKVVEKLEEVKNKDTEIALDEAQKERCFWYAQGMNRAIEIVKGGGVDEQSITDSVQHRDGSGNSGREKDCDKAVD